MKNRLGFYKNDNLKIDLQRQNIELCIIRFRKFLDHQKKYIAKQTERQICERQPNRQTDRGTDRQTDKQTDSQRQAERCRRIEGDNKTINLNFSILLFYWFIKKKFFRLTQLLQSLLKHLTAVEKHKVGQIYLYTLFICKLLEIASGINKVFIPYGRKHYKARYGILVYIPPSESPLSRIVWCPSL